MVREGNLKILQIFFKVYLQPCGVLRVNFCIFQLGNSFWRFEIYVQMESSKVEVRRGMVGVGKERFIVWNNLKFSCEGHFFRSSHRRSSHLSQLYEKKESLLQVFSCEFCKISKNIFLQNTLGRLLLIFMSKFFPNIDLTKYMKASNNLFTSRTSVSLLLHLWSNQVADI